MTSGLIFNIQRFSIQDGPGIRTTVFLKGCPLECWWCHNPESQSTEPELTVIEARCVRCGQCWDGCSIQESDRSTRANCTHCGECVSRCPTGAREMIGRRMTADAVMVEILKDRMFYEVSSGGVTFSGGEPLAQPELMLGLLQACRREGLHTAIDTCGHGDREDLLAMATRVDLILYDLKIVDDTLHQHHTGVSNRSILANLRALSQVHENIWLRIPFIPGFNDSVKHLEASAQLAASLPGVRQVNLLPYHPLGTHKTHNKIQNNESDHAGCNVPLATIDQLNAAADRFRAIGLTVRTSG